MRERLGGWEHGLSPETINNFRQNTPELIIRDARRLLGLSEDQCGILRDILLARGVNKWLRVRRMLIRYKHKLKAEIKVILANYRRHPAQKAALATLNRIRGDLRAMCHSERWVEWPQVASAEKAEPRIVIRGPVS